MTLIDRIHTTTHKCFACLESLPTVLACGGSIVIGEARGVVQVAICASGVPQAAHRVYRSRNQNLRKLDASSQAHACNPNTVTRRVCDPRVIRVVSRVFFAAVSAGEPRGESSAHGAGASASPYPDQVTTPRPFFRIEKILRDYSVYFWRHF